MRHLGRLLRPVIDALDAIGSEPRDRKGTIAVLLRECLLANSTFWSWNRRRWVRVLGQESRAFHRRNHGRLGGGVRTDVVAVAYVHGWFRDVLALGSFSRTSLAARVFGSDVLEDVRTRVARRLERWGYVVDHELMSVLCEALLLNESPRLEDLTADLLKKLWLGVSQDKRSAYTRIAKALMDEGIVDRTLRFADPGRVRNDRNMTKGVPPEWDEWCSRWGRTSTLASRQNVLCIIRKMGRWLAASHPDVVSPAQWTRDTCADFVGAISRMRVGDFDVTGMAMPRAGKPLAPRTIAHQLSAVRIFFWDCQEWGWIARRFDPGRSLALPRSVSALISTNPRIIADDTWAKLLWAGLNIQESDLRRTSSRPPWPLSYVRAVAAVWLFGGLRSAEICRLHVGCVRWQEPTSDGQRRVCLLDIPVSKTMTAFAKPVDPHVGRAIETWEAGRPEQPKALDPKTGELVDFLFVHRGRRMRTECINRNLIPILCDKAGVPGSDVRGKITSHRARATIASQLFNGREPMSLFELQAWLGHGSPASTQHYVAITPMRLAKAYRDAGYFERNVRAIEVLIDRDAVKKGVADGEPWRYYDLGHGFCTYEFFDQCAHRMACAKCDFYRPRQSSVGQLVLAKTNILRLVQEIPLTEDERAAVDGDLVAIDRLTARLATEPTPSGQTPIELSPRPQAGDSRATGKASRAGDDGKSKGKAAERERSERAARR